MFTIFIAKLSIRYYCPLFSFCCVLDCGKRVTILSSCKSSYQFEVVNGKVRKLCRPRGTIEMNLFKEGGSYKTVWDL